MNLRFISSIHSNNRDRQGLVPFLSFLCHKKITFYEKKRLRLQVWVCYQDNVRSPIAQSVEQVAVNHWVGGSSPSRGAILNQTSL